MSKNSKDDQNPDFPEDITEIFGSNVFHDRLMKERLPKDTYTSLKKTIDSDEPLGSDVADVVANAMKDWAIEKGATHYTHWFQPLTGTTAEKHDSFIEPTGSGTVIMEFSGKQLIQGEPDASSFPSGGLRATFEARGYTAWDATSPAFLKEDAAGNKTLCIPTAFCSYTGESLDKKTPLLRSMSAASRQAIRILRALGNTTSKKAVSEVGPEQEYFLVDKEFYEQRMDLITSGRTIFGAPPPKGQELEDHYFGAIKDRISEFMRDLDVELWKMGITSKTKHNEVAPGQYEMAPIFSTTNIATDHNQLVMETMEKVALRHNLVCLLHEKPYAGINGSGKHCNWSITTDDGINMLKPGKTPRDNMVFLLTLAGLIQGVDKHADILRASAANSGNDHRLGANEAPPAIISIFLGEELTEILMKIAVDEKASARAQSFIKVGVDSLPQLPRDNTDRNRTSPFAFTGNKFEFRMVGSSASIAGPCIAINTIICEAFDEFAARLEKAKDVNKEAAAIIKDVIKKHGRVIFNGNNYSDQWVKEAKARGLPNIPSTAESLKSLITKKSIGLFGKYNILSDKELHSRYEIYAEQYSKHINIEALTAVDMVKKQYLPAVIAFTSELANTIVSIKQAGAGSTVVQEDLLNRSSTLLESAYKKLTALENNRQEAARSGDVPEQADIYRDKVYATLRELRKDIDALEVMVPDVLWPVPPYADLLFKI